MIRYLPVIQLLTLSRRHLFQISKLVVTVGLLTFILRQIGIARVGDALADANVSWIVFALLIYLLPLWLSTLKWGALLRSVGIARNSVELFRAYLIGFFFSSTLPGSVGGDLVRWHIASGTPEIRARVAATILAERITGVVCLLILCFLLLFIESDALLSSLTLAFVSACSMAIILGLWLAWDPRFTRLLSRYAQGQAGVIFKPLHKLHAALRNVPVRALLLSIVWSLPFYASTALFFFIVSLAFGADISYVEAASVQLLVNLLILIPISLGGLGVAQAADVYLLGLLGVDGATALSMSLVRQATRYVYAVPGGLLYAQWRGHPSMAEIRKSTGD